MSRADSTARVQGWRAVRFGDVVHVVDEAVCALRTCGLKHIDPKPLRVKP